MKIIFNTLFIIIFITSLGVLEASDKPSLNRMKRVILQKNEQQINLKIIFGAGKINILPAGGDTILSAIMYYDKQKNQPEIDYSIQGDKGYLSITSSDGNEKENEDINTNINSFEDLKKNIWTIRISQKIIVKMQIVMGAANSNFNFGRMKLSDLTIECGASDSKIDFPEENPVKMGLLSIKAGVSKIHGFNFLNANFKRFLFEGGVGIYHFDMGDRIKQNADIELNLGGASAVLSLNDNTPFVLKVNDSFLSSIRVENASKRGSFYKSYNYQENDNYLNIDANIGIGNFELLVGK